MSIEYIPAPLCKTIPQRRFRKQIEAMLCCTKCGRCVVTNFQMCEPFTAKYRDCRLFWPHSRTFPLVKWYLIYMENKTLSSFSGDCKTFHHWSMLIWWSAIVSTKACNSTSKSLTTLHFKQKCICVTTMQHMGPMQWSQEACFLISYMNIKMWAKSVVVKATTVLMSLPGEGYYGILDFVT